MSLLYRRDVPAGIPFEESPLVEDVSMDPTSPKAPESALPAGSTNGNELALLLAAATERAVQAEAKLADCERRFREAEGEVAKLESESMNLKRCSTPHLQDEIDRLQRALQTARAEADTLRLEKERAQRDYAKVVEASVKANKALEDLAREATQTRLRLIREKNEELAKVDAELEAERQAHVVKIARLNLALEKARGPSLMTRLRAKLANPVSTVGETLANVGRGIWTVCVAAPLKLLGLLAIVAKFVGVTAPLFLLGTLLAVAKFVFWRTPKTFALSALFAPTMVRRGLGRVTGEGVAMVAATAFISWVLGWALGNAVTSGVPCSASCIANADTDDGTTHCLFGGHLPALISGKIVAPIAHYCSFHYSRYHFLFVLFAPLWLQQLLGLLVMALPYLLLSTNLISGLYEIGRKMKKTTISRSVDNAPPIKAPTASPSEIPAATLATALTPAKTGETASLATSVVAPSPISQQRAREIMGRNMSGIEEAIKHFGVNPSRQQLAALADIPFTEATLESCKETHVLVAVFPLSILDVRFGANSKLFYNQDWYSGEPFAKDKGDDASWHLIRKDLVPNSISRTWQGQRLLLSDKEEAPTARVMIYTIIGHFLATGERLFERVQVRCSDVDSDGYRVSVGYFDLDGLVVYNFWDVSRYDYLGVASARKFPA